MSTSAVSGSSSTTTSLTGTTSTSASAAQDQISSDFNFFLTMFTTQLQNQDPTSPLDPNEFTQQIAQFSTVQQAVVTNQNLEKLIASNNQSAAATAVNYIGKEIESTGNTGVVSGGQGAFSYILPEAAQSVQITIKNSSGQVVFTGAGQTSSGRNVAVWDGVNSTTGAQEPDGVYSISISATNAAGKTITPETRAVAVVSGVETDSAGTVQLITAAGNVAYDQVLAVRSPTYVDLSYGTNTSSSSGTDTSSNTNSSSSAS